MLAHGQNPRVGSTGTRVSSAGASASTKHSAGMLKKLSASYCTSAKFLRLTSPNFLVTGPAALVATAKPRSNKTLRDVYMI